MKRYHLTLVVVIAFLMMTSMGLIYVKHQSRNFFSELEILKNKQHKLDESWGRLMLEQSVLLSHDMVERVARQTLRMQQPVDKQLIVIKR
ncbi:hypothetical protein MNBD_GAMMA12-1738 [hydrothermal vent metagenome]|uniref:Cell division protein FtsL n=1 Tax=hydrothermal vent metagenome TaxID=652676 RepID=A0A3B0XVK0_9ZZZZ